MKILGISCFYHDSAAALCLDGRIVAAVEEERFSRKKHDSGFPKQAIDFCLKFGGVRMADLDYVVFYEKPFVKMERLILSYLATWPRSYRSFVTAMPIWLREKMHIPSVIRKETGYEGEILYTDHHLSHAASCFLCSPFEEAAIFTIDGVGEWNTASYGIGRGNRVELTHEINFPHSLGLLYSAFTGYLGFRVNDGEYKVMGMAPYGTPVTRTRSASSSRSTTTGVSGWTWTTSPTITSSGTSPGSSSICSARRARPSRSSTPSASSRQKTCPGGTTAGRGSASASPTSPTASRRSPRRRC